MRVRIFDIDANGNETFRDIAELAELFAGQPEYWMALDNLQRFGRYWGGGGASPMFLLLLEREH